MVHVMEHTPNKPDIPPPGEGKTVLIVEDDRHVRNVLQTVLVRCGYHLLQASHGEEALRLCAAYAGPVHLVICDVVMPGMKGRELVLELARRYPGLKVLFVSGYTADEAGSRDLLIPGLPFLPKPFGPDLLTQTVRALLDEAREGKQ